MKIGKESNDDITFPSKARSIGTYTKEKKSREDFAFCHHSLIQNQPLLKTIFKTPPIISFKKGKSLKDMLVRAKI